MQNVDDLIKEYTNMLDNPNNTENEVQAFLENNTVLIPLPFLLNHQLHMNAIISKFPLGREYITDFAYLTKSSDEWYLVLVEIEDPKKKIFTNNQENVFFSADFNHAYDQITSWKAYIKSNKEKVLDQVTKLRLPLNENRVSFKYVLIFGRSNEKRENEKRRAMLAEKNEGEIQVMTYDSLISEITQAYSRSRFEKIMLSPWKEQGFKIKSLPKEKISTALFIFMTPEYLKIEFPLLDRLKREGYDMDSWLEGIPLELNEKQPRSRIKDLFKHV